jgi:hypothetical protein
MCRMASGEIDPLGLRVVGDIPCALSLHMIIKKFRSVEDARSIRERNLHTVVEVICLQHPDSAGAVIDSHPEEIDGFRLPPDGHLGFFI